MGAAWIGKAASRAEVERSEGEALTCAHPSNRNHAAADVQALRRRTLSLAVALRSELIEPVNP